ncbi:PREDICTED: carbonic anhydrase 3-like isoform X2 [Wasmannia auropunctata]|uniref:carbonic anhydrase 3-like isoform X2 n=1 Tax=Wasmannia auropunctata TaxID=64793 RepID=UPI0005EE31BE|nr:PREDICTED: carbonic anhydrase 3-like isoform X2 [Wasmannia auropunctata]
MESYIKIIDPQRSGEAPIDLNDTIVRRVRFPPLILNGHWLKDGNATLLNNGEKAFIFLNGDRIPSTVSGGPLINDKYEFHNAHFHWGENDCRGAEHTINGTWFSMECHLVHWNQKYLTFEECLKHPDGLCVLAYLFLVQSGSCEWYNVKFEKISENLKFIQNAGSEIPYLGCELQQIVQVIIRITEITVTLNCSALRGLYFQLLFLYNLVNSMSSEN